MSKFVDLTISDNYDFDDTDITLYISQCPICTKSYVPSTSLIGDFTYQDQEIIQCSNCKSQFQLNLDSLTYKVLS